MRPLPFVAAVLALATANPVVAAPRAAVPGPVLVVADVGESAQRSMPAALWRKLVADYVGARNMTAEDGTALPDDARCRNAHALYAVFATFDRAARLPGLGQESDRAYGIARFTVRNCQTGIVSPTKIVRIESEPLPVSDRGDLESNPERTWDRAVRTTLAHDPLILAPVAAVTAVAKAAPVAKIAPAATALPSAPAMPVASATSASAPAPVPAPAPSSASATPAAVAAVAPATARITRIENGIVFLDTNGGFAVDQVLRDVADRAAHPHAPIELVVVEVGRKYVAATVVGNGTPRVGDYVEAAPALK